jgi:hypothetical protein
VSVELQALYAHCEQSPGDLACYGAVADELDGLGYAALGHAFRWMHKRRVWPHKRERYATRGTFPPAPTRAVPAKFKWAWYSEPWPRGRSLSSKTVGVWPVAERRTHALPPLLLVGEQLVFGTHQAAVMYLADRLTKLNAVYSCEPPKPPGLPLIDVLSADNIRLPPFLTDEGA